MNSKAFFDSVRNTLFGGRLTQGVVDTINAIFASCAKYRVTDSDHIAYILATAMHESYHPERNPEWKPVREGWGNTDASAVAAVTALFKRGKISRNYALPAANGKSYFGRGFVQITHSGNYMAMGKRLGLPLYENPDLALQPKVAADLLVLGMRDGTYTGKKLSNYDLTNGFDFRGARRIINGIDQAERIARLALKFKEALEAK